MRLKLCQLTEYQVRTIFMDKSCRKCTKASPRPLFNFGNHISHCMQEILLKIRYFERLSKSY